jgi:NAD/NADP transhydrogenase beta subunit
MQNECRESAFYKENTRMLFGDARKMVEAVLAELPQITLSKST